MKGFKFGEKVIYTVLGKLGEGWESTVYRVYAPPDQVMAAKISQVGDEAVRICPSWSHGDFDLRRKDPFKIAKCIDWYSCAEEEQQEQVLGYLKLLKQQYSIHSHLKRLEMPYLLPPLEDRGMLLLLSSGDLIPAVYEIYPLIKGQSVSKLLESLESVHLSQSFMNTGRVSAGLNIEDTNSRLADLIEIRLLEGVETLIGAGYTLLEADFHPSNLMFGSIDGGTKANQIYLIDHRLCHKGSGCHKEELIFEIRQLCERIRNWSHHGIIYESYFGGLIDEITV